MRYRAFQFVRLFAALLLALGLVAPALAVPEQQPGQRRQRRERQGSPMRPPRAGASRAEGERGVPGGMRRLPPRWEERLRQMPPEKQRRFLENNKRFRSLPPERQEQIRRRLERWNRLTPEQRQALVHREEILRRLPPEQRRFVLQDLFPRWRRLPPERRHAIVWHLRQLRGLSEEDRTSKLKDENFLRGLNPEERQMLSDLSKLRVGPGSDAAPDGTPPPDPDTSPPDLP